MPPETDRGVALVVSFPVGRDRDAVFTRLGVDDIPPDYALR